MNRQNNVALNPSPKPNVAAPVFNQQLPVRITQDVRDALKSISGKTGDNSNSMTTSDMAAKNISYQRAVRQTSGFKWKSSFTPVDKQGENCSERTELYNPYDPCSSDSDSEMSHSQNDKQTSADQDKNMAHQNLSSSTGCSGKGRWDVPYSKLGNPPLDRCDMAKTGHIKSRSLSPGHRLLKTQKYSPDAESAVSRGYGSISRPLDHRLHSPDGLIPRSSTQNYPGSYGAPTANGENRISGPESRIEMDTVRLSPPRLHRDYQHSLPGYQNAGPDNPEMTRHRSRDIIMNKNPISCDLCEVEFGHGQELQDHLESKAHWDMLEHIQQENNYDDLVIAFLQDAMLYKSRQCSRPIEDSVLQALQENDHMTKVEMFLCAACNVFLTSSASSVQAHITSQDHLSNIKEFGVRQRRTCLDKAEAMMKELQPQFEHFLKGGSPFE